MVRIRKTAPVNPPEPDLAIVVANLQRQLLEQQQETNRLREQLAQLNQRPHVNEVPPPADQVPPVAPPVPDISRMKAPEFDGTTDPIAADNWLIDIQVILDFMRLTEQEKVLCASFALKKDARHWWMIVQMRRDVTAMSWQDFMAEFRTMYYNREVLAVQQDEFANLKQGTMTEMEAVKKFEQLAHLCPELVPSETEKVRRMMKMFRTDIAKQVSTGSNPPTLVSDCVSRVIRAEYWINQDKEAMAQIFKAKKEEKAIVKQTQPVRVLKRTRKARPITLLKVPNSFGGTREKGISRDRDSNEITLRRRTVEETRVITLTTRYVRSAERNIRAFAEWGPMRVICAERRDILQRTAL
ncbi:hypothetical protein TIFTF001_049566 [Ficus carica]|uniref:Retrotransposon gag domain-containing protein n=1 Tax=Ficus carica TaxID=3494 RepID=A0AA87ZNG1_FICCA|nr:hypothetical protein TIFTF001_049563 [Ficus carica]GMN29768.1 hypothetical protein TIFTF001_049566 [Ficus carica]